jgi:hypothetical protein
VAFSFHFLQEFRAYGLLEILDRMRMADRVRGKMDCNRSNAHVSIS